MERGWDPEIKKFLRKVIISLSLGLLWLIAGVTGGIYYELAYPNGKPILYTIFFYAGMAIALLLLIRFLFITWKKNV
jgi:hypothetical protein